MEKVLEVLVVVAVVMLLLIILFVPRPKSLHQEAIESGHGEYNSFTGDFQWKQCEHCKPQSKEVKSP